MKLKRRLAAHRIQFHNYVIDNGVVEIENGVVKGFYKLHNEQARTEWIGGTITIKCVHAALNAFKEDRLIS